MKFLKGVLRVSLIAAVTLVIAGVVVWQIVDWRNSREAAELGNVVAYSTDIQSHASLGALAVSMGAEGKKESMVSVPVNVRMTWRDSRVLVQFDMRATSGPESTLTFRLKDSNGFEVAHERVTANSLVNIFDKKGGVTERQGEFSHYMSADSYRLVKSLDVLFTGEWFRTDPEEGYFYDADGSYKRGTAKKGSGLTPNGQ